VAFDARQRPAIVAFRGEIDADLSELGSRSTRSWSVARRRGWLHVEMMDDSSAFVDVGGLCLWISMPSRQPARITHVEARNETAKAFEFIRRLGTRAK
jgi:hypothetical protein